MAYILNTDEDRREMLDAIGRSCLDDLFDDLPDDVRRAFRPLDLAALSEMEVLAEFTRLAEQNEAHRLIPFLGGGIYDHFSPSVVSALAGRSEFATAYTPYQPEISQGTLTAMFEFQTFIADLTGMEIASASLYDGGTALAEAALMAERVRGRGRIGVARSLFPHLRRVLETYAWGAGIELIPVPSRKDGCLDQEGIPENVSGLVVQSPNAFGLIEPLAGLKERLGEAMLIAWSNPVALALLEPPGALGADVVVGEGQPLGLPMGYGGPLLGLFATREEYMRQLPGRVAGRTVDVHGHTGYVMAAQTREQHIRRARATSNICTNSALCALTATIHLATLGGPGLRRVAERCTVRAHELADRIWALPGYDRVFDGPFFNEFVVRTTEAPDRIYPRLLEAGCLVSPPASLTAVGLENVLRFAVTEKRTTEEFDRLIDALGGGR